jgi:hypothetical protein
MRIAPDMLALATSATITSAIQELQRAGLASDSTALALLSDAQSCSRRLTDALSPGRSPRFDRMAKAQATRRQEEPYPTGDNVILFCPRQKL